MSRNESANKKTTGYSVKFDNVKHDGGFDGADGKDNQSESSVTASGSAVNRSGSRDDEIIGNRGKDGCHNKVAGGFAEPGRPGKGSIINV